MRAVKRIQFVFMNTEERGPVGTGHLHIMGVMPQRLQRLSAVIIAMWAI